MAKSKKNGSRPYKEKVITLHHVTSSPRKGKRNSNDKRVPSPSGGQTDFRKSSINKISRQAHETGPQGLLGRNVQGAPASPAVLGAAYGGAPCTHVHSSTSRHRGQRLGLLPQSAPWDSGGWPPLAGGRLPSLEAQEPKPSNMAVPPGVPSKAETSMDLSIRPDGPRSPDTLSILKAQLTPSLPGSLQQLGPQVTCTDPP